MTDTLRGVPEAIEAQEEFASSIEARDDALALLATSQGIGPPDLCWLQKSNKGGWSTGAAQPRGYYHFVLGRDTSGPAAVAAYFAEVTSLVEPLSLVQGLVWYQSETKIERGFYCCFDPVSRLDLRSELCIPGGVLCGAVDAEGGVHEVTPQLWDNCALASFLRSELYDPELTMHSDVLHRSPHTMGIRGEQAFLQSVIQMYAEGTLPHSIYLITQDPGCGCIAEHMDLVLFTIFHYLGRQWRWQEALSFFSTLAQVHPVAAVYTASCQRELGSFEGSFNTLSAAMQKPQAMEQPSLLVALGVECLYAGQVQSAINLARQAIQVAFTLRPAWLLLARCYIRLGDLQQALVVLNLVPCPPHLLEDCQDILFTVSPPRHSITEPSMAHVGDPEHAFAKRLAADAASATGPILPGAVLLNREPLDMSPWPDVGAYRAPRAVLSSAYGLLQEIVAEAGWDGFLELRARVFVMHSEASEVPAQSPSTAQRPASSSDVEPSTEAVAKLSLQQEQQQLQLPKPSRAQPVDVFANATAAATAAAGQELHAPESNAPSLDANSGAAAQHERQSQQDQKLHAQQQQQHNSIQHIPTQPQNQQVQNASQGCVTQPEPRHDYLIHNQEPALQMLQSQLDAGSVVDLGSILASREAGREGEGVPVSPAAIQGTPSLWDMVFLGSGRSNATASGAQHPLPSSTAGPVASGSYKEAGLLPGAKTPGPLCKATEQPEDVGTDIGNQEAGTSSSLSAHMPTSSSHAHASTAHERGGSNLGCSASRGWQPPLRSVDSDREAVIFGCQEGLQQDQSKRMCVRWLDGLIIALWHDLQAYIEWKAQDAELLGSTGKSLADLVLELPNGALVRDSSGSKGSLPKGVQLLPPGEWLRRGLLAERLCHDSDALLAYRCCIKAGGFNLVALTAIMRLAAHSGEALEAVRCCHAALSWHCEQLPQTQQTSAKARPVPCPLAVSCCLKQLVARLGIDAVRTLVAEEMDGSAKVSGMKGVILKTTMEKLLG